MKQQKLSDDVGKSGEGAENEQEEAPSDHPPVKVENHESDPPPVETENRETDTQHIKSENQENPETQNAPDTPQPQTNTSENAGSRNPGVSTEAAVTAHQDKAPVVPSVPAVSHVPSPSVTVNVPPGLPPGMSSSNPDAIIEEKGTVSALYVGRVIGKGGGTFPPRNGQYASSALCSRIAFYVAL